MLKKIAGLLLAFGFASLTWAQQIDLNKATEMELDALKGVGPVLTKEVMNERKKAPFKDWDDVTSRVKGIGMQKASSLSMQGVRVQGSVYKGKTKDKKQSMDKAKDNGKEKGTAASTKATDAMVKGAPAKN